MSLYVKDGDTGIVCDDETVDSCAMAYRRILSMNENQYVKMRSNAKAVAETGFNLNTYVTLLGNLIEGTV